MNVNRSINKPIIDHQSSHFVSFDNSLEKDVNSDLKIPKSSIYSTIDMLYEKRPPPSLIHSQAKTKYDLDKPITDNNLDFLRRSNCCLSFRGA
jgi:uncharacterized UPF0146 family protein